MFTTSLKINFWAFVYPVTWKSILVFRIHQNGSFDILQRKTKKMVETLQKIIINDLLKNCDQDEKFEKKKDKFYLHCFIDEVLFISSAKHFWLCRWPVYCHKSDMKNYCDPCLLYHDLWIFSLEFDDVLQNDVFKIYYCFALFFNSINYWCGVNEKVVDDYFEFFPTFEHRCFR